MKHWLGMAVVAVLMAAPTWAADMPVGSVSGGTTQLDITATPSGDRWDFSGGGSKGTILFTFDELRQAQGIFNSCMRMDVNALPAGRSFPLGSVKGMSFEVEKDGSGRKILVRAPAGGHMFLMTLDGVEQAQLQTMFVTAMQDQRVAGGPSGGTTGGMTQPADPNTLDNAKALEHHWHPTY